MKTENSENMTARRFEQLAELYRQGYAGQMLDQMLNKLFSYEAGTCKNQIRQLQDDLSDFEIKYRMSSDTFYQNFLEGKVDDRMDFIEWASLIQMLRRLKNRLALLTLEQNHEYS